MAIKLPFGQVAERSRNPIAIPAVEPAPVAITASDRKPADALDIPLPEAATTTLTQADWYRVAMETRLADEALLRDLRLGRAERDSLTKYYAEAERPLAWARDGAWTPAAHAVIGAIKAAAEDGLNPTDYPLPDLALRKDSAPAQWAEADLKLSAAVVRYARDARGGRLEPSRLSPLVTPKLDLPDAGAVLAEFPLSSIAGAPVLPRAGEKVELAGVRGTVHRLSWTFGPSRLTRVRPSVRISVTLRS